MKALICAVAAFFLLAAPVSAQFAESTGPAAAQTTGPVVVGASPIGSPTVVQVAPPAADFSIGTWIADLLGALVAMFGSVIATFLTRWVMAVAKKAGVEATQAMSDRLDSIIENGLHVGALQASRDLTGKLDVKIKDEVIARAVTYAQDHGADTIKGISGLDVNDPKTVQALQARAAKALSAVGPDAVLAPTAAPVAAEVVNTQGTTTVTMEAPAAAPAPPVAVVASGTHPTAQALP
jgi:hypothetical protein